MIFLHPRTAQALSNLGMGPFTQSESEEKMAWIVLVLRHLRDEIHVFPRGKWATIQEIERQLLHAAVQAAEKCTIIPGMTEEGA